MAGELLAVDGMQAANITQTLSIIGMILGREFALFGSETRGYNPVIKYGVKEELMTIAAAATSDSALATLLPANSLILAVIGRVTVAIPTAATFLVGDATQTARFASGVAVAANTTFVQNLHWNPTVATANLGLQQSADARIRITPNLTPATAVGRVALQVAYLTFTAPTA
jgi:hypothetical protein